MKSKNFAEVYRLRRTRDGSEWLAFKAEEHEKLLNDILAHLGKMEEILNRPVGTSLRTDVMTAETLFCTNCGRKETSDHNYCGRCGSSLPKS